MLPREGIILDAGTGIFRARDLIETPELQIFLTHTHLDHVIGLTFLLDVLFDKPVRRVQVYVEASKRAAIEQHLFHSDLFPVWPPMELLDFPSGPVPLADGGELVTFPLQHPGGCLGFRLKWPTGDMAYVTDTTASPTAPYLAAIQDVNLLVHECYFPDGWEDKAELTGHSCLTSVAQVAAAARARRTCLVHLSPLDESDEFLDLSSVRSIYSELLIPEDGQVIEF